MLKPENPFQLTRAADLTDEQIIDYWVDLETEGGFSGRTRPSSQTAMILMGGKGCGKTHLMRYFSFQLQALRARKAGKSVKDLVEKEKYIGIYLRSSGLNSSRFSAKGQDSETWAVAFSYYFEIWLAQLVLLTVEEFIAASGSAWCNEDKVIEALLSQFDKITFQRPKTMLEVRTELAHLQRELDYSINNCSRTRTLKVNVLVTRGNLIFGLPKILVRTQPFLKGLTFVYLIDEYENLYEEAQKYINTLVREKENPVSFKLGAKLYGLRTFKTLSGGEEIKEGSEYEKLVLDADLRGKKSVYSRFADDLVRRRIDEFFQARPEHPHRTTAPVASFFWDNQNLREEETELGKIRAKYKDGEARPWLDKLKAQLEDAAGRDPKLLLEAGDIDMVMGNIVFSEDLLLEKTNCFLLYRAWFHGRDLAKESRAIAAGAKNRYLNKGRHDEHDKVLEKFRSDLVAQMCRQSKIPIYYLGFDTFVEMSQGIVRNLLIILKLTYDWAAFNGERPFRGTPISVEAQSTGVGEASEWFYRDAQIIGADGVVARRAIDRLGELFKAIRFSDKPSECSICTFSVDLLSLSPTAQRIVNLCEQWSLLVKTGDDRKDRNSDGLLPKYQLNSMLAPRYSLPIASRGNISLDVSEAEAIFASESNAEYDQFAAKRVNFMNAPFGRLKVVNPIPNDDDGSLPLFPP